MSLVDTSFWTDDLRAADAELVTRLGDDVVLGHPWVVGELASDASPPQRRPATAEPLPMATVAGPDQTSPFIDGHRQAGAGIRRVDCWCHAG